MNLKYVCRNDGYIIDRKLNNNGETTDNTFTTKGTVALKEILPEDEEIKKNVIEHAFDSMRDNVLETFKKKYLLKDDELITYFFEGKVQSNNEKMYAIIEDRKVPVYETDFNLDFEVEVKITPKNFLKVHYDNIKYRVS